MLHEMTRRADITPRIAFCYFTAGLAATSVNFLSRLALSAALPFEAAVLIAQAFGFVTGFLLYRTWVFQDAATGLPRQLAAFVAVNLFSTAIVLGVSITLRAMLLDLDIPRHLAEAAAHAGGLASGALFNFIGHRLITFARNRLV